MWKECFDASVNSEFLERLVCWEADRKFLYPQLRLHTSMEVLRRQWGLSRFVYKTRFQSVVTILEIERLKREKEMERIYMGRFLRLWSIFAIQILSTLKENIEYIRSSLKWETADCASLKNTTSYSILRMHPWTKDPNFLQFVGIKRNISWWSLEQLSFF